MIALSMADSERIGPYRVIQWLGAGGMGEVVLAHDARLDRLVAIKRLHDDRAATPERRERFRREARILARLNHPAIVQIHDVLHQDGHDYLIMEYVEGQTLRARCEAGPMTVSELLDLARQITLGMAAAHDLGVVHRDLKAENVLITRAGREKLTDFGIAKLDGDDKVTADGAVIGTLRAMSPEQALGLPRLFPARQGLQGGRRRAVRRRSARRDRAPPPGAPRSIDVLLFEADVVRHRDLPTGDRDRMRRAMAALGDTDRLLPDTYSVLAARFDIALAANGLDEASALLDRLVLLDPDSSTTHLQRARLYRTRGEFGAARGELDAAAQRDAFSWRVLYDRARVFRDLGDRTATRTAIDQVLARSPGNYGGLSLFAREELDAGRPTCAEQIYTELVKREPRFDESVDLGRTLDLLGRHREAAESFGRALAIRPDDPDAQLDLDRSLLLAGDATEAHGRLQALRDLLVRKRGAAPDGAVMGDDLAVEAQTLAYLGRDDLASAAAARSRADELLARGSRPAALYTAALVHAYLGDREIAARYATAYLDGGNSPADFAYPWFDDLRRDPSLGPRLAARAAAHTCEAGPGH